MVLKEFLGTLGVVLNFVLQLAPMKATIEGIKLGYVKSLTVQYFAVAIYQTEFWFTYGMALNDFFIYFPTASALFLFMFYMNTIIYLNKTPLLFFYINVPYIVLTYLVYNYLYYQYCAVLGTMMGICWQSTNIINIRKVLSTKDSGFINLPLSWVSWLVFFIYWVYSILIEAWILFVPNFVGWWFNNFMLLVYYWANDYIADKNTIVLLTMTIFRVDYENKQMKDNFLEEKSDIKVVEEIITVKSGPKSDKELFLKKMEKKKYSNEE